MNYHDITKCDMLNGDGLRVVLWVAGCSHHCMGCQNPQTWDPNEGILFDDKAKEELFEALNLNYISGITFSGGDPLYLYHREEVLELMKEIKKKFPNKTMWLYTGFTFEEIIKWPNGEEILSYLDVLVDGRFILEERDPNLLWVGSPNQRVIDVQKTLQSSHIIKHCEVYYEKYNGKRY
jgi:anaerobic ribonucleoside-triphosphate reductase activating protein